MSSDSQMPITQERIVEDNRILNSDNSKGGSSKVSREDASSVACGDNGRLSAQGGSGNLEYSSKTLNPSPDSLGNDNLVNKKEVGSIVDEINTDVNNSSNNKGIECSSNLNDNVNSNNAVKTTETVGSTPNKLLEPFMLPSSSRLNPLVGSYLEKLSPTAFKGFQKRFFRLNITDNALLYWREEPTFKDQQPQGSINLSSVIAIHIEDALNFVIRTHGRDYCLKAFSPGDKDIWLESICMVVNSVARIETLKEASAQYDFAKHLVENSGGVQNYLSEALKTQRIAKWTKEDNAPLTFSLRGKKSFLNVKNIQNPLSKLWFDSTFGFKYYNNSAIATRDGSGGNDSGKKIEHCSKSSIPRSSSFCTSSFSSVINTNQYRSEDFIGYSCRSLNTNNRKKSSSYFYGTFRGKSVRINKISNMDFIGLESSLTPTPINNMVAPISTVLGGGETGGDLSNGNNTPRIARFNLPCNSGILNHNIPFFMENSQQFEWSNLFQNAVRVRSHLDNVLFGTVYVEIGPIFNASEGTGAIQINQSSNTLSSSNVSNSNFLTSSSGLDADLNSAGTNTNNCDTVNDDANNHTGSADTGTGNDNIGNNGSDGNYAGVNAENSVNGGLDNNGTSTGNEDDVNHNGNESTGNSSNLGNPNVVINTTNNNNNEVVNGNNNSNSVIGSNSGSSNSGYSMGTLSSQYSSSSSLVQLKKYFALLISSRPIANNEAFFPLPNNISLRPSSDRGNILETKPAENFVSGSNGKKGSGSSPGATFQSNKNILLPSVSSILPFDIQLDCLYLFSPEYDDSHPAYVIELDNIQLSSKIREVQSGFQFKLQVPLENILTYVTIRGCEKEGGSSGNPNSDNSSSSEINNTEDASFQESSLDKGNIPVSSLSDKGIDGDGNRNRDVNAQVGRLEEVSGNINSGDSDKQQKPSIGVDNVCHIGNITGKLDSDSISNLNNSQCVGTTDANPTQNEADEQLKHFKLVSLMEQLLSHQKGSNKTMVVDTSISTQDQQNSGGAGSLYSNLLVSSQTEKVSMRIVSVFGPDAEIWREALIASCRARHAAKEQRMRTLNDEVRAFDSVPKTLMEENASKLFYKTLYYILSGGGGGVNDEDLSGIASIVDSKKSNGMASVFGIRNLEFRCNCVPNNGDLAIIGGGSFCKSCLEKKLICHISSCFVTIPISRILHGLTVFNSTIKDLKQASIRIINSPRIDVLRFIHEKYLLPVLSVVYECFNTRTEFIKECEILSVLDFLVEIRVSYELCGIFDSSFKYLIICYAGLYVRKVIKTYFKSIFRLIYDTCHFGRTYRDKETGNLHTTLISKVFGTIYSLAHFFSSLKLYNLSVEVRNIVFVVVQHAIMQFQMVLRDVVLYNICKITDSDINSQKFFFKSIPSLVENKERCFGDYLFTLREFHLGDCVGTDEIADMELDYSVTVITTEVICGILNEIEQCIYKCDELDLLLERWTPFVVLKFEQEFVKDNHYFNGYLFGTNSDNSNNNSVNNICLNDNIVASNNINEASVSLNGDIGGAANISLEESTGGNNPVSSASVGGGVNFLSKNNSTQSIEVDLPNNSCVASSGVGSLLSGAPGNGLNMASSGVAVSSLGSMETSIKMGSIGGDGIPLNITADSTGTINNLESEGLITRESLISGTQMTTGVAATVVAVGINSNSNSNNGNKGNSNILENMGGNNGHFMNTINEECFADLDMFVPRNLRNETRRSALLFNISQMYLTIRTCKDLHKKLQEYFVGALKERYEESYRHLNSTTSGPSGGETPNSMTSPLEGSQNMDGVDVVNVGNNDNLTNIDDKHISNDKISWANYFLSLDMSSLLKEHLRPQLRILKISLKKRLFSMVSKLVLEYTVRVYIESLLLFSVYYSCISDMNINGIVNNNDSGNFPTTSGDVVNEFGDLCISENSKLIAAKLLEDWDIFGHFFQDCMSEEEVRECLIILADLHDILISQKISLYEKCREFQEKYRMFDVHSFLNMVATLRFEDKGCNPDHLLLHDGRNSIGGASTVFNMGSNLSLELDRIQDASSAGYLAEPSNAHPIPITRNLILPAQNIATSPFHSENYNTYSGINWSKESEYSWTRQMNLLRGIGSLILQGTTNNHGQQHIHHNHSYFSSSDSSGTSGGNFNISGVDGNPGLSISNNLLSFLNVIANNRNRRLNNINFDVTKPPYLLVEHGNTPSQTTLGFGIGPSNAAVSGHGIVSTSLSGPGGSSVADELANNSKSNINMSEVIGPSSLQSSSSSSSTSSNLNLKRSFSLEIPSQVCGDETNERGIIASFLMGRMLIYSPTYLNITNGFTSVFGAGVSGGLGLGTASGSRLSDLVLNIMMEKDEKWWNCVYNYYSQVYIPNCLFGLAPNTNLDVRNTRRTVEDGKDLSLILKFQKDTHPSKILNKTIFGKYIANYYCFLKPPTTEKSALELLLESGNNVCYYPNNFITGIGNYNPRVYFGPVNYKYSRQTPKNSEWKSGFLFIEDLTVVIYESMHRLNILDIFSIRPLPEGRITRICIDPQDLTRTGFIIFWGDRDSETLCYDANSGNSSAVPNNLSSSTTTSNNNPQKIKTNGVSSVANQSAHGNSADGEMGGGNVGSSNNTSAAESRLSSSQTANNNYFVDSKSFSIYFRAPNPKLAGIWVSEIDELIQKSKCIWGQNLSETLVKKRLCQYLNPIVIPKQH
ncbi:41 Kd oocyst wall [Cryptosporidium xiaoi]|uniref:41 Kd oocyst wall n=1 Tax=Cryptosporidium xiaoi TaxID=659607 RepID=A0AAV9Y0I7_9CRYT